MLKKVRKVKTRGPGAKEMYGRHEKKKRKMK